MRQRVIPVLLLRGEGLVKGVKFKDYRYIGDPINAVHIFNKKEVDELFFLDITATRENRKPRLAFIQKIADECYMPFGVGGGIYSINDIREILSAGAEKVSINTAAVEKPELITEAASLFGSQAIVVSIDYRKKILGGLEVFTCSGKKSTGLNPVKWAIKATELGAGEILINCIDRDGTMEGYDINTLSELTSAIKIPVIACGGAGKIEHFREAVVVGKASAVAAGSMFVFHGRKRAVLINYPYSSEIELLFNDSDD